MRILLLISGVLAGIALATQAYPATLVVNGTAGAVGANSPDGHGAVPPAGAGGPGETVTEILASPDSSNDLTTRGGDGGIGGHGGNATYDLPTVPFAFGGPGGAGGAGGTAGATTQSTTTSAAATARSNATGGVGGQGGQGGTGQDFPGTGGAGGAGGNANAAATAVAGTGTASVDSQAHGGNGGPAGTGPGFASPPTGVGPGGRAGNATASGSASSAASNATASAVAQGGIPGQGAASDVALAHGGDASANATAASGGSGEAHAVAQAIGGGAARANNAFGTGGFAQATASATSGTGAATAEVLQAGGDGAPGAQGPLVSSPLMPGGPGQSSTLTNAVSGSTAGLLTLTQVARGGNAGPNGTGGTAVSTLNAANPGDGALVVNATAFGGYSGGSGNDHTASFAPAGPPATASATATDSSGAPVEAHSTAGGGGGGAAGFLGVVGIGGTGTSNALAIGLGEVTAAADGVSRTGGMANTSAEANRAGPIAGARVATTLASGQVGIPDFSTERRIETVAGIDIGTTSGGVAMPVRESSAASLVAAPKTSDVTAWLAGNPNAETAGMDVIALGSLANHVRAATPELSGELELDLTSADFGAGSTLALAFLDPSALGGGLELLHLSLARDGVTVFDTTFTNTAAALAGLDDAVIDVGSLGSSSEAIRRLVLSFELNLAPGDLSPDAAFALDFAVLAHAVPAPEPGLDLLALAAAAALAATLSLRDRRGAGAGRR